ncbi:MFS general substrate transporter [Dendrothele bispora CBS 962.96]|uniref:MFS general substrate transporter n=1 Tax=Dendrothele bispora (strain CBS 962.96) TaxID=1314807 RepID=A0A4S8LHS7_DENBC|nr:MFS general substrate transporter [Dendrothele bispora CBS 962.96]
MLPRSIKDEFASNSINNGPTESKSVIEQIEKASVDDVPSDRDQYDGSGLNRSNSAERKLVKKLDMRIMPSLWAMYFLNYLDRSAIAQARLNGLEKHLGLVGSQFNVCVSILFVGYTLVQSYSGLLAVRCLLGIAEAPLYPGAIYLLSLFYPRREIATRQAILYSANILAISFSGLIAAATFATLDGKNGLFGWQYLFIIEGCVTFGIAIIAIFMLPDHPLATRWLTPEERELAQYRMDADSVGIEPSKGAIAGLKQAVVDGKLWVLVILQTLHLAACGFNSFFPTVVSALGYNSTLTLVLTCPPYLSAGVGAVLLAMSSGKHNERAWHITASMLVAIVGFIISCVTLDVGARYTSCFLFCIGAYAANSIILGWIATTCSQTQEKKAASLSIVNMFANASFIYTPYLYPMSDGPKYLMANAANASFTFCVIICTWILKFWLMAENRKIHRSSDKDKRLFAY